MSGEVRQITSRQMIVQSRRGLDLGDDCREYINETDSFFYLQACKAVFRKFDNQRDVQLLLVKGAPVHPYAAFTERLTVVGE